MNDPRWFRFLWREFLSISHIKNLEWRKVHLRFCFNYTLQHDLVEKETRKSFNEAKETRYSSRRNVLIWVLFAMQWQIRFVSTTAVFRIYSRLQYLGVLVNKWWRVVRLKGSTYSVLLHTWLYTVCNEVTKLRYHNRRIAWDDDTVLLTVLPYMISNNKM